MGRKTSKIRISGVPRGADVEKLMSTVTYKQRKNIIILEASVMEKALWTGRTINITVQAEIETLENIPEIIKGGETHLIIFVDGRKP